MIYLNKIGNFSRDKDIGSINFPFMEFYFKILPYNYDMPYVVNIKNIKDLLDFLSI
jgi:hypothetical protein